MRGILAWLQAEGIFHFRLNNFPMPIIRRQGNQRVLLAFKPVDTPGLPDIAGVLPDGRAFFIEVKRPGAKPQNDRERVHWDRQRAFLENATANKALAIMVDSVDAAVDAVTDAMDGDA
jgi:predicted ATPase